MASDKRKCWASILGECDGLSREHIFSRSVFSKEPGKRMAVSGLKRIPNGEVGPELPASKILCRKHNSELSILDSEAKILADALRAFQTGPPKTHWVHVKGLLLERWAMKTIANQMVSGLGDDDKWEAAPALVEMVFGLRPVPDSLGLHSLSLDNYLPLSDEQTVITPMWHGNPAGGPKQLTGAAVYLHGAAYFVALQAGILNSLREKPALNVGDSSFEITAERLKRHPPLKSVSVADGRILYIMMDWA